MLIFKKKYGKNGAIKEERGSGDKFWQEIDGKFYLFKPNSQELKGDFGEVIYSNICKTLGVNCVNANFATCINKNSFQIGALIECYYNEKIKTINACDIKSNVFAYLENYTVNSVMQESELFAKKHKLKLNAKLSALQLSQQTILDYFLMQADRNSSNIEFLIDGKKMQLAPIFDNADILGMSNSNGQNNMIYNYYLKYPTYDYNEGKKLTIKIPLPRDFYSATERELKSHEILNSSKIFCQDILQASEQNKKLKKLVQEIISLDLYSYFAQAEKSAERELPKINKKLSALFFERKKELIQNLDTTKIL